MYMTQIGLTAQPPDLAKQAVCGRYLTYPDNTGQRQAEGGLRVIGAYKQQGSKDTPLVTIVTTVLNNAAFLETTITSVLTQDYEHIEYIIIDGNSSDGTLATIQKYEDAINYYVSEPDSSLYEGINKGISLASGEYILILNADDWYAQDTVSKLLKQLQSSKAEFVSGLAYEVDLYGQVNRCIDSMPYDHLVMLRMPLRHELMLVSKDLYNAHGPYDPAYKIIGDLKFTQRLFRAGATFQEAGQPLMFFRKDGISADLNDHFIQERCQLLAENFPELDKAERLLLATVSQRDFQKCLPLREKYSHNELFRETIDAYVRFCTDE